ncbi:thioredoxin family protein [Salinicola rhizosphaerae]|uniref:Thiol reductase thioredoxin n=1 Tax=Salinicola rhizosphaerae TaxID=1443141 RepID=A0ABQ3EHF9_9GAMM|nr:thioredoxin family protein [Salinicola rhizosphaerae]GHB34237.1 thiol reductase thioredoxin [Salinicola rhizosphaerae]
MTTSKHIHVTPPLPAYTTEEPTSEALNRLSGPAIVEFGAPWCPWCQAAQPLIREAISSYRELPYFRVEDGKGRRLGRAFHVKLWPTFVFLRDGKEVARCVRPESVKTLAQALAEMVDSD